MDRDRISSRQLFTLTFAALLAPAIGVLPGQTARLAGEGGWLSALVALPLLLILCRVLLTLLDGTGAGLGETAKRTLGPVWGRAAVGLCLAWGMFLLAANARLAALRFLTVSYRNASLPLFLTCFLAVTFLLVRKPVRVLARTGEVFFLALAVGLVLTLIMGAFQMDPGRVLPLWWEDLPDIACSALPVLGLLGYVVFAAFLAGRVERREGERRRIMGWAAGLCLTFTGMQLVCLGNFGPGLSVRMNTPFYMMVKGIGIEGTFQRLESVVLALWVLSDLALLGLLAQACCLMAENILPIRRESAALPVLLLALAGGLWLFPDAFLLGKTMERTVLTGNLLVGFVLPLLLLIVKKLRRLS